MKKMLLLFAAVSWLALSASATNLNVSLNLICTPGTPLECTQSLSYPGMGGPTTASADFSVIASGWTVDLKTNSTQAWCDPTFNVGFCAENGFTKFAAYGAGSIMMTAPGGLTFAGKLGLSSVGFLSDGNGASIFSFSGFWSNGEKAFGRVVQATSGPGLPLDDTTLLRTSVTPEPAALFPLGAGGLMAGLVLRRRKAL